jgi:hypothetical protein
MLKETVKNWKTSLIGVVIICGLAYSGFKYGFEISEALAGLIALGFLKAKDKKV